MYSSFPVRTPTHCWTTIDRRMSDPNNKRYPMFKGKGEAPSKMACGANRV